MTLRVAILGCGPSGLLAAEGVRQWGFNPTIISRPEPSRIGGAQYLHRAIPEVTPSQAEGVVIFQKVGTACGYSKKLYDRKTHTSWDEFDVGPHRVWNMQSAYNLLWGRFSFNISPMNIRPENVLALTQIFDAVFSTIPLKVLCQKNHSFIDKAVYISEGASEIERNENKIIWNGLEATRWYRQSNIFGHAYTEWPYDPGDRKVVRIRKPIKTDCDCQPGLLKLGRYGEWRKGVLSHHAYEGVVETLRGAKGVAQTRARLALRNVRGSAGGVRAGAVLR